MFHGHSWMRMDTNTQNTITLFEERGGDPSMVNFRLVVVGTVCARVHDHNKAELSCHNWPISAIKSESFGNPSGYCGSFAVSMCQGAKDATKIVGKECVGKLNCTRMYLQTSLDATKIVAKECSFLLVVK